MDYKTPEELEELNSLLKKNGDLVGQKKEHELALLTIRNQIRMHRMTADQYRACCEGQQKRVKAIQWIEQQVRSNKVRMREISAAERRRYAEAQATAISTSEATTTMQDASRDHDSLLFDIAELRDEYRRFSADASRISSMRRSAAEFANKLDEIIDKHK